jgi:F-type H+-transporting ATPase subunit b
MTSLPLNIDIQQICLHWLNLVILFFILYFLLYKPVKNFMDKRKQYFADLDNEAKEKLASAEKLKTDYEAQIAGAEEEIHAMKEQANKTAQNNSKEMIGRARKQAVEILDKAQKEANEEHMHMIEEADSEIDELVAKAAEKLVFSDTSEAYEKFLKEAEGTDLNA